MEKILALSGNPQSAYSCGTKREGQSLMACFRKVLGMTVPRARTPSSSSAAQRYTPAGTPSFTTTQSRSVSSFGSKVPRNLASAPANRSGSSVASSSILTPTPSPESQPQAWILLGIKGPRRTLEMAQIPVHSQTTDYSAFQALKDCYQTHRGRFRLWFSIWRMENCEVVKV